MELGRSGHKRRKKEETKRTFVEIYSLEFPFEEKNIEKKHHRISRDSFTLRVITTHDSRANPNNANNMCAPDITNA